MTNQSPSENDIEIGAAYIRVSTDDQTELSPDAQLREILKAAKEDGYVIPKEFIFIEDKGRSGRRADNRPEFQRMISIAKMQPTPFKRLYLWKFSRFARNQDESTFYKGILRKKCGIEIISVSEPIAQGMFGRLIETIIEWFDEYYSYNLSGEVLRGMTEKALRNGYQSTPCLGYNAAGNGKPHIINEAEYRIAEFIHTNYHDGKDITAIAREANQLGYRSKRGNLFYAKTIKIILTNKFYVGTVTWNGISFQGSHECRPSIVSIFDDNQKRIESEYRPFKRREVSSCRHWLSGLVKCSICGASLSYTKPYTNRTSTFQCWRALRGEHSVSNCISTSKTEAAVLESLKTILDTGEIEYERIPKAAEKSSAEEVLLKEALSKIEIKEKRIQDAYENGITDIEEYKNHRKRLNAERSKLLSELIKLKEVEDTRPCDKTEVLERIRTVYDVLQDPSTDYVEKGNAIRTVLKKVEFDRKSNEFRFFYYA